MKTLLKFLLVAVVFLSSNSTHAQIDLVADSIKMYNGMEYGYTITNAQTKEDYERYEIKFFVTNNSCTKYVFQRPNNFGQKAANVLCDFTVLNATGKRLTSKSKTIYMSNWNYTVTDNIKEFAGKDLVGKTVQIGYTFRKGDTMWGSEIILTPKGEKPKVKMIAVNIPDL
jgi:hypothetical protein